MDLCFNYPTFYLLFTSSRSTTKLWTWHIFSSGWNAPLTILTGYTGLLASDPVCAIHIYRIQLFFVRILRCLFRKALSRDAAWPDTFQALQSVSEWITALGNTHRLISLASSSLSISHPSSLKSHSWLCPSRFWPINNWWDVTIVMHAQPTIYMARHLTLGR